MNAFFHGHLVRRLQEEMVFLMGYRSLFLFLCSLLCSCASVSVKKIELLTDRPPNKAPAKIFVRPATFYEPGVRVDRAGAPLASFKYELGEKFTRNLVKLLSKHVAPATAVAATAPLPRGNYWLITTRFDKVNQGSRLLRSVVGFGAGGTKLETSALVYDLSKPTQRAILLIQSTGGSNVTPGVIGTAAYFVTGVTALFSAGNLLEGVRSGVTFDVIRTTRQIAGSLSEFLHDRGALPEDKVLRTKRVRSSPAKTESSAPQGSAPTPA
jgi:hypothetical protein